MPLLALGNRRRSPLVATGVAVLIAVTIAALARFVGDGAVPGAPAPEPRAGSTRPAVEFDRFSARHERSETEERLSVSLRLRNTSGTARTCFVFVVARNDQSTPKTWAIWPPQSPGPAITAGGHFHGATPSAGSAIVLGTDWQRVTATVPESSTRSFDTVIVYVVGEDGRLLFSRPFRV